MMMNIDDTITIINAAKMAKQMVHESPMVELTKNANTLSLPRLNRIIYMLTDDIEVESIQTTEGNNEEK